MPEHTRRETMRKITVDVSLKLVLEINCDRDFDEIVKEVVEDMEYDFTSNTNDVVVLDSSLEDFSIVTAT